MLVYFFIDKNEKSFILIIKISFPPETTP